MNKFERMKAAIEAKPVDKIPVGFWLHFPGVEEVNELRKAHIHMYRQTNMDLIKIMYEYGYDMETSVKTPSDWYKIKPATRKSSFYKKQVDLIKGILDECGGECMIFSTMYGPFKSAVIATEDALLMEHSKENPKAVCAGINAIAEGLADIAQGYLEQGLDGIYYAAQFSEPGRFSRLQWESLVKPYDLKILNTISEAEKYTILHICGEPEYDFKTNIEWYQDYPADLVNWAVHKNNYALEKGRRFFNKPILGGIDNRGTIYTGTHDQIANEVTDVLKSNDLTGFVAGADCTLSGDIEIDKIKTAVEAVHNFK